MIVHPLYPPRDIYRCIDYLLLGERNTLQCVNTLIDAGGDARLFEDIAVFNTGMGKRAVEQIILTHSHFDHTSAIKLLKERWNPQVLSFTQTPHTTRIIRDGDMIPAADGELLVIHTPLHSNDSVCLWNEKQGVLFSGDVILNIKTPGGSYPRSYVDFIDRLLHWEIKAIYSGHDKPVTTRIYETLLITMKSVLLSEILD